MHAVKDDLKSGDLFIKYGERYDDYREQLVDDETFEREVGDYGQVTGIETDPGTFVAMLKSAMSQRSEEHTSELQSLMRISYAVFCLQKKQMQSTHQQ